MIVQLDHLRVPGVVRLPHLVRAGAVRGDVGEVRPDGFLGEAPRVVSKRPPHGIAEEHALAPGHARARDAAIVEPERGADVPHDVVEVER